MMSPNAKKVTLTADRFERKLEVDGVDLTPYARGAQLMVMGGEELPVLTVQLGGDMAYTAEVEAVLRVDDGKAELESVVSFLESCDPQWLEQAMLEAPDLGSGMGETALRALLARARAEHGA